MIIVKHLIFNNLITINLFLILLGCNQVQSDLQNLKSKSNDSTKTINEIINKDSLLISFSKNILQDLKEKNIEKLINNVHNSLGLRFSPYINVDTINGQKIIKENISELYKSNKIITWGIFDGSGEPINKTFKEYINKFVYDKDFLNAEQISVNKFISQGNLKNNVQNVFPNCDFVEFYYSSFDKKHEGMDWESLILVLKTENNKPFLVAIIHSQWTI
ncbi:MAG: hypothetical protein COS14_00445 [Bacteroidetes bacterium CG02_land_8_20_14_3_00_31_25]|nr:MAG: hypothetical protein COS14_00445 [Bacteroidetes bacterium CG02_land_8_20_14_3_00_31_25]